MRFIGTGTVKIAMSSSRFNGRGQNQWRRSFGDRLASDGRGGGRTFVSGDSHVRSVRNENHGLRQGYRGDYWIPRGLPQQQFLPRPPGFRSSPSSGFNPPPPPPPRPADHRHWIFSVSQPPPPCERFTVLSYNILADYLARDHRSQLYFHIPYHILDWEWRKRRLFLEFGLWAPDIMCLQEVDRFHDLEAELAIRGYTGIWKMRTGNAVDGCAIFWRTNRFQLCHEEHIEFNKLGLRDNVAQICVFESRIESPAEDASVSSSASSNQSRGANQVVICNIHVLYNPKRGEIKLGQVRVLLDRAYAVSRLWNNAPVIVCGDFNCTPQSPLYKFISEQKLSLSALARDQVSGQYRASIYAPQPYAGSGLYRAHPSIDRSKEIANGIKQGNYCIRPVTHIKTQNDIQNASVTEKLPPLQRSTNTDLLENACSDTPDRSGGDLLLSDAVAKEVDEGTSAHCRKDDPSEENGKSSKKQSEHPVGIGNDQKQALTPTASVNNDPCFGGVQQDHAGNSRVIEIVHSTRSMLSDYSSQSNANVFNELIDTVELDSSSKNCKLSHGLSDSSAVEKGTSEIYIESSVVPTMHKDSTGSDIRKRDMACTASVEGSAGCSSEMTQDRPLFDDALLDHNYKPPNGGSTASGVSSFEMVTETSSANVDVSTLESMEKMSADWTIAKQKAESVIPCQSICEINPSDLSTCGTSSLDLKMDVIYCNEAGRTIMEDACSDGDHDNSISTEILAQIQESGTLPHIDTHSISTQPNLEEAIESYAKSCSVGESHRGQLEQNPSVGQVGSEINDLNSSEENSDPDFLKELLGTEDACQYMEDVISTSDGIQSTPKLGSVVEFQEDSSHSLSPQAFDSEKRIYNPYLWTPMEVELASGNAECTSVEHNLKLRSAYTDVEDYSGTKDSSREPQVTSYHRQFMGTVDYIWCSEGLQTVKVLDTIPKHVLQRTPGFPTPKWGSDHLALACQLAFTKGL